MVWPIVAAIAASTVANELQNQKTAKADKNAKKAMEAAVSQYNQLVPPELSDYTPEAYQYLGSITPEQVSTGKGIGYEDVNSALSNISPDPQLRERQMASMAALEDIIQGGGFNAQDKANLNRIQSEAIQADKGRRDAILQNMHTRGMGGSGMELLAQLQSSQAATDRQNQAGLDIAGQAQQRALEAIMQQGAMAGNLRSQDFGEAAQKAQAQDAIAKFNAANKLNVNQFNSANQYDANKFNVNSNNQFAQLNQGQQQQLNNANVDLHNNAQLQNNNIKQQQFGNDFNVAQGKANAYSGQQNYYQNKGKQDADQLGQLMNSGLSAVSAYYGAKK